MLVLELDEFAVDSVVFLVGDAWRITLLVALARIVDGVDEVQPPRPRFIRNAHDSSLSTGASSRTKRPAMPSAAYTVRTQAGSAPARPHAGVRATCAFAMSTGIPQREYCSSARAATLSATICGPETSRGRAGA